MISPSPPQPSSLSSHQQQHQRLSYHRPTPYHIAWAILIGWQDDATRHNDPDLLRYGHHIKVFLQQTHNRNTIIIRDNVETTTTTRRTSLYHGPNLQEFCTQFYRSLPPTAAARLVTKFTIWCRIVTQSLDTFMDFMSTNSTSPLLQGDRSSQNGILVRALGLGYDMLSFDQVTRLYEAFLDDLQRVNLTAIVVSSCGIPSSSSSPPPQPCHDTAPTTAWIRSSEQVDQTLRQYCYHPSSDRHDDTTTTMNQGDDVYPQLPSAHFLKFRTALAQHERVEAHTSLYEFIDRTLISSSRRHPDDTTTADILQYASILQAMCHHSHHQIDHMNQAMEEAIRVIQQQSPPPSSNMSGGTSSTTHRMTSTLFVMAWCAMAQWDSVSPTTTIVLLQRCMETCRSIFGGHPNHQNNQSNGNSSTSPPSIPLMMGIHLWHAALTHSWISHDRVISFYTVDPGTKTTASATLTSTASTQRPLYDRPIHTIHLDNLDLMTNVLVPQKMVAAQIYYANNEIALSLSTLMEILHYYYDDGEKDQSFSSDDTNHGRRHHPTRRRRHSSSCQSMILMAIRNVSLMASTTGSTRMADLHWMRCPPRTTSTTTPESSGCIYQQAIITYLSLCDQYSISVANRNSIHHEVMMDLLFLFHEWAVRRHEFDHANAILTQLENYDRTNAASSNGNGNTMLLYHKILSLSRQKQYGAVITMLTSKIPKYKARQQYRDLAWTLLQLSRIYIESNRNHPTAQFVDALQPVLECLSLSKQHKIYGLHNEALLVLAHIHLLMGQYQRTIPLLQMILPALLANHHISVQAEAFLILGQCRMRLAKNASGPANQSPPGRRRQSKLLKTAIREFHRCQVLYEQCHDCRQLQEIHYLLAHSYHHLSQITTSGRNRSNPPATNHGGNHGCRDDAASQYAQYTKRLSTTASTVPVAEFMAHLTTRDGVIMLANRPLLQ